MTIQKEISEYATEKLRPKINMNNIGKQSNEVYKIKFIDGKESDEIYQMSKNHEEKMTTDIEVLKVQKLRSQKKRLY